MGRPTVKCADNPFTSTSVRVMEQNSPYGTDSAHVELEQAVLLFFRVADIAVEGFEGRTGSPPRGWDRWVFRTSLRPPEKGCTKPAFGRRLVFGLYLGFTAQRSAFLPRGNEEAKKVNLCAVVNHKSILSKIFVLQK